ncbi:hypothetical protein PR002_g838 [Phytophthora rubi]|uniref:Uncharacterized protein n=1 Tax=Phytophthora rubi TaxID=129364 RepID=A0A6A3NQU7_9STRA|nr:hypothetical protein PR002_g838 [Phytophthora rubi]
MVGVIGGILLVPLVLGSMGGWSVLKCLTFSISMILGFISIVQYTMAFNGAVGLEVAMWSPMMTLRFLMDMMVGHFLAVPLFVLSQLPFMRILQTRGIYKGGFSRALSSGSEVAASLCILLGGFIHGFTTSFVYTLGYINDTSENFMKRSFYYFVTTTLPNIGSEMLSYMENGYLKITCAGVSIVAVLLSLLIGRVLGCRVNMAIGGSLIFVSLGLNFISTTSICLVSCGLAAMGSAMLVMSYLLYSYEICSKGWRGKSATIFLLSSITGWRCRPALLVAFFAILRFVPDRPVWLLAYQQEVPPRAVLVRLRRRQNVNPEIAVIQAELTLKTRDNHLLFRLSIVFALQAVFGFIM